ncbi:efflux RND transporter periplasmic adaptor subunit [Cesiribacter sp. SM1]|uniref:efflux RND transporter periplasmic adaptor subunit n=1 Tax=Cesiribacter sp. SM1 TaxID=2861196 RepID=UPI001CD33E52|nr:efflux RND transporter periplasmic adaptor subunit [Cesiribacter sp. SM1]
MLLEQKSNKLVGRKPQYLKGNKAFSLLLLIACLSTQACSKKEENKEVLQASGFCLSPELKQKISTQTAQLAGITESRRLSGKVEYNPDRVVNYVSLVGGVVTNTYFSLGDKVEKGQVLAEIRSAELSSLESERKRLTGQLGVAARNVESVQSMYEDDIASERSLLEARSEQSTLEAELNKVRDNLALYSASSERGVFQIKAPVEGFVVSKQISAGMQIAAEGDALFTISNLDEVWVTANIYAADLPYVQEGMEVQLQTTAYGNETFSGKIQGISQVFSEEERVLKARIVMENTSRKLKPGMFVNVVVKKQAAEEAVLVPQKAIIFNSNRNYVVIYQDDCNLRLQEVAVLSKDEDKVYLSAGLQPGSTIVTQNQLLVYEALKNKSK